MTSNIKRAVTLTLLAGAASSVLAAKAPVTDLSTATSSSATVASLASAHAATNETDIQRLERLLQNRNRVQAQMQQQLDEMTQEIATLRGELERNSYNMDQMLQRQRELFIEIDKLRSQGSTAAVVAPAGKAAESTGKFSTDVDEQTAYQNAVDLILKKRDYAGAIAAFKQFQTDYPDSTFAPNTHYWLGQLYFAKRQDSEAEASFKAVLSFKESNKRADALVKLGDLAKRGNKAAEAKKYYQQVVDEYPASSSAKVAQTNLQ
ncbi:tol-pal system protein YbgF [Vibrio sp. 10N.261.51.F12]|uniref:tol-pal system protein YbgF n=1 Tax=Vibrio sp. 10N.261.51.F12 TaxID=3229679 RepID=UPI0035533E5E